MIDEKVIEKESKTDFKNTRAYKFRYRTRYFSDSGIIGSKAFVSRKYRQFKDIFHSKHEKKPKPVKGLDGVYSLKRLSESWVWYGFQDLISDVFQQQLNYFELHL